MKPAILLIDHGSREPEANALLEALAERLRARLPGRVVETAHMELAPPDIGSGVAACRAAGARRIVVQPYFLGPGRHTREDIPRLVAQAARRHPGLEVEVVEPLGLHDAILDVVLARLGESGEV